MNFLVIGLGSMGKRRVRCLKSLNQNHVFGFDVRADRRQEANRAYGIEVFDDFSQAVQSMKPHAFIISAPPDRHHEYMSFAVKNGIHFFVEASVLDDGYTELMGKLADSSVVAAPSATLLFHPGIRKIFELVKTGELGRVSNFILHSGQFLPDWHSYEKVSEFYVSNPLTGGCREIVPFELSWVTKLLGFPKRVCGNFRETICIEGADGIDDTYNCLLDYGETLASITVDVVSRRAVRRLLINGDKKQLSWDWDVNCVRVFDPEIGQWQEHSYEMKAAADGYNANIGENMYIDEVQNFLDAIAKKTVFQNSMADDLKVLRLLYAIEKSDRDSEIVRCSP